MSETRNYSDQLLVSELKNHNEKAFRSLFDLYYQDIYGYSMSLLKSKELAEENVQDVFLKVWLHRENLNLEQSFKSYLFTIARNQAFNLLNKATNDAILKEEIFYESQKSYDQGDYSIREADCKKLKNKPLNNYLQNAKRYLKCRVRKAKLMKKSARN